MTTTCPDCHAAHEVILDQLYRVVALCPQMPRHVVTHVATAQHAGLPIELWMIHPEDRDEFLRTQQRMERP